MTSKAGWYQVPCPNCNNANRHARRTCKATGGPCRGTGVVMKFFQDTRVPKNPSATVDNWQVEHRESDRES